MGLDGIFGSSNSKNIATGKPATPAQLGAGEAAPTMAGDSYTSSQKPTDLQKEISGMTPAQAESARKVGGYAILGGMFAVGAAYWGAGALVAATGVALLPAVVGVAGAGLALWGAMKFAKGLGAAIDQASKKAFQLPEQ